MSHQANREYLSAIFERYQAASRKEKSRLLSEAEKVCQLSRRQIRRQLNSSLSKLKARQCSGRPREYLREILQPHVRYLWIAMERISARRMKPALVEDWLKFYECEPVIKAKLRKMSVSTLERILKDVRGSLEAKKGLSTTCPARYMKNKIPIRNLDHKITKPGFTQTDTVAHCGTKIEGTYAHSITLTDIDSTWTENRAVYGKKALEIREQFLNLRDSLPFELLAINSDSGSEFLNEKMLQFTSSRKITFTRSRPYRKNDNCWVEQKNYTHVRELFGYQRIEERELVDRMNHIYINYWNPLNNFFLPTFKLKEKHRIGSKIIKKYDKPQTPYHRLMQSPYLSEEQKISLFTTKQQLNPFILKAGLEKALTQFFQRLKQLQIREIAA